jgi:ribosome-binding factor A
MRDILKVYYNIINDDDDDDDVTYDNNKEGRVLLRRCVLKHPQILSLSLGNLLAKSEYFDSIDISMMDTMANATARKIKTTTLAARILMTTPSVYSLSLQQNIIPKVNYLSTSIWGMNRTTISNNLYEYPQILTLSMQGNIIPTLSFYNMTGYIKLDTYGLPQQTIESHKQQQQQQQQQTKVGIRSRYIATSLYNRLLPRWHFLLEERERRQQQQLKHQILSSLEKSISDLASFQNITTTATTIHLLPSLHLLAGASDGNFCYQMNISLTEYINYKEKEGARLKFTSQFDTWLKTGRPIDLDD